MVFIHIYFYKGIQRDIDIYALKGSKEHIQMHETLPTAR